MATLTKQNAKKAHTVYEIMLNLNVRQCTYCTDKYFEGIYEVLFLTAFMIPHLTHILTTS